MLGVFLTNYYQLRKLKHEVKNFIVKEQKSIILKKIEKIPILLLDYQEYNVRYMETKLSEEKRELEEKILSTKSEMYKTITAYGSEDLNKILVKLKLSQENLESLVCFNLLITQSRKDISGEVFGFYYMKITYNNYEKEKEKILEIVNNLINELDLKDFKNINLKELII